MKFKVFLLKLERSPHRFATCEHQLRLLDITFERISAVDGEHLTDDQVRAHYNEGLNNRFYKKTMNRGEIACYLSHKKAWKKIVSEELDYAIILEDDFYLTTTFSQIFSVVNTLKNWDYIRLAAPSSKTSVVQSEKIDDLFNLVYFDKFPIDTLAQAVSYQAAKKLLQKSEFVFRPVDVDIKHWWEKPINVMGLNPTVVFSNTSVESDITKVSNNQGRSQRSTLLKRVKFVLRFNWNNFRSNMRRPSLSNYVNQKQ